jgi:Flp pilus assembly protein TadD
MKMKILFFPCVLVVLNLAVTACAPAMEQNQLKFGVLAAQNHMWDEAVFRWQKVLQQNPDSAAAHNNLAVAYERMGRWEEAEKEYQLALELEPDNEYVQSNFTSFQKNIEPIEQIQSPEKKEKKDATIK